jgi:hypothetical protein
VTFAYPTGRRNGMKTSPIGAKKRAQRVRGEVDGVFTLVTPSGHRWLWPLNCMTEAEWDGTLMDWAFKVGRWKKAWHCTTAQKSEAGFFDRVWLMPGKALFTELKVRYASGTANRTSTAQDGYIYAGIEAGLDVRVWTWPDDAADAWVTLTGLPLSRCPYKEIAE